MFVDDFTRVKHMLTLANDLQFYVKNRTRADLDKDRTFSLVVIKTVETLGEAASKITRNFRNKYPKLPWLDMIDMRNRLIHDYYAYDYDDIWLFAINKIPPIIPRLEAILLKETNDDKID